MSGLFADYRAAIADWFRVLQIGGHLVIAVPHQFLFERKLFPPSRWDDRSSAVLHSACCSPRSRRRSIRCPTAFAFLEENDQDFDYADPAGRAAERLLEIIS